LSLNVSLILAISSIGTNTDDVQTIGPNTLSRGSFLNSLNQHHGYEVNFSLIGAFSLDYELGNSKSRLGWRKFQISYLDQGYMRGIYPI